MSSNSNKDSESANAPSQPLRAERHLLRNGAELGENVVISLNEGTKAGDISIHTAFDNAPKSYIPAGVITTDQKVALEAVKYADERLRNMQAAGMESKSMVVTTDEKGLCPIFNVVWRCWK